MIARLTSTIRRFLKTPDRCPHGDVSDPIQLYSYRLNLDTGTRTRYPSRVVRYCLDCGETLEVISETPER